MEPKKPAPPKVNTPPSEATSQYPPPSAAAAIPTTGLLSGLPPMEPKNPALPKLKTPPSEATSQYAWPASVAALPTIGLLSVRLPSDPWNGAPPNPKTPPSDAASQYDAPEGPNGKRNAISAGAGLEAGEQVAGGRAAERAEERPGVRTGSHPEGEQRRRRHVTTNVELRRIGRQAEGEQRLDHQRGRVGVARLLVVGGVRVVGPAAVRVLCLLQERQLRQR